MVSRYTGGLSPIDQNDLKKKLKKTLIEKKIKFIYSLPPPPNFVKGGGGITTFARRLQMS